MLSVAGKTLITSNEIVRTGSGVIGMSWGAIELAVKIIGPVLTLGLSVRENWLVRGEPLARSLRQREHLQKQAMTLDALGEHTWARRRYHSGEMAVAMRLSRFEEYQEHPMWSLLIMVVPVLWGVSFMSLIFAVLMGLSGPWGWVFSLGGFINVSFGVSCLALLPIQACWFDWRVRRRALRRIARNGRALRANRSMNSPGSLSVFAEAQGATAV